MQPRILYHGAIAESRKDRGTDIDNHGFGLAGKSLIASSTAMLAQYRPVRSRWMVTIFGMPCGIRLHTTVSGSSPGALNSCPGRYSVATIS